MDKKICYCFGYSEEDIIKDVLASRGRSVIMARILAEKKAGGCNCGRKHPLGK